MNYHVLADGASTDLDDKAIDIGNDTPVIPAQAAPENQIGEEVGEAPQQLASMGEIKSTPAPAADEHGAKTPAAALNLLMDYRWMMTAATRFQRPLMGDLKRGQVTIFAGPPGVGKTLSTIQTLAALAAGAPFAGNTSAAPAKVALLSIEDGDTELGQRMAACVKLMGLDEALLQQNFKVVDFSNPFLMFKRSPEGVTLTKRGRELQDELADFGADCFALDPISALHDLPENDNGLMTLFMAAQQQLARDLNCAIINLHHFGKENADRPTLNSCRGAGAIVSVARNVQLFADLTPHDAAALGITDVEALNYFRQFPGKLSHAQRAGKIAIFGGRGWRWMASRRPRWSRSGPIPPRLRSTRPRPKSGG